MTLALPIDLELANALGFAGTAMCIAAYWYITWSDAPNRFLQHGLNLVGSSLLLVSLTVTFNAPSFLMEAIWAMIGAWGLLKAYRARGRSRSNADQPR